MRLSAPLNWINFNPFCMENSNSFVKRFWLCVVLILHWKITQFIRHQSLLVLRDLIEAGNKLYELNVFIFLFSDC